MVSTQFFFQISLLLLFTSSAFSNTCPNTFLTPLTLKNTVPTYIKGEIQTNPVDPQIIYSEGAVINISTGKVLLQIDRIESSYNMKYLVSWNSLGQLVVNDGGTRHIYRIDGTHETIQLPFLIKKTSAISGGFFNELYFKDGSYKFYSTESQFDRTLNHVIEQTEKSIKVFDSQKEVMKLQINKAEALEPNSSETALAVSTRPGWLKNASLKIFSTKDYRMFSEFIAPPNHVISRFEWSSNGKNVMIATTSQSQDGHQLPRYFVINTNTNKTYEVTQHLSSVPFRWRGEVITPYTPGLKYFEIKGMDVTNSGQLIVTLNYQTDNFSAYSGGPNIITAKHLSIDLEKNTRKEFTLGGSIYKFLLGVTGKSAVYSNPEAETTEIFDLP